MVGRLVGSVVSLVGLSVGGLGVWSFGLSFGWWISRSVVCLLYWLVDRSFCWLLPEQITFSSASPVPIKGYFWNFVSHTILASATNGASEVGIGRL